MTRNVATHYSFADALAMGPPVDGNLAVVVFRHGSMEAELYTPDLVDLQTPHAKDEIYVVARGEGEFFNGQEHIAVQAGALIFVPAGVEHRFRSFSDDFAVWVIFYGPQGGEAADA